MHYSWTETSQACLVHWATRLSMDTKGLYKLAEKADSGHRGVIISLLYGMSEVTTLHALAGRGACVRAGLLPTRNIGM